MSKKGGSIFMKSSTCPPWTSLERGKERAKTGSRRKWLFLSRLSVQKEKRCLSIRKRLHWKLLKCLGRLEMTPNGLLVYVPMISGWTSARAFNSLLTVATSAQCMREWRRLSVQASSRYHPLNPFRGDIITDHGEQLKRWAEHYRELYLKETVVTDATIENNNFYNMKVYQICILKHGLYIPTRNTDSMSPIFAV